jgi:hypothetical protein
LFENWENFDKKKFIFCFVHFWFAPPFLSILTWFPFLLVVRLSNEYTRNKKNGIRRENLPKRKKNEHFLIHPECKWIFSLSRRTIFPSFCYFTLHNYEWFGATPHTHTIEWEEKISGNVPGKSIATQMNEMSSHNLIMLMILSLCLCLMLFTLLHNHHEQVAVNENTEKVSSI